MAPSRGGGHGPPVGVDEFLTVVVVRDAGDRREGLADRGKAPRGPEIIVVEGDDEIGRERVQAVREERPFADRLASDRPAGPSLSIKSGGHVYRYIRAVDHDDLDARQWADLFRDGRQRVAVEPGPMKHGNEDTEARSPAGRGRSFPAAFDHRADQPTADSSTLRSRTNARAMLAGSDR